MEPFLHLNKRTMGDAQTTPHVYLRNNSIIMKLIVTEINNFFTISLSIPNRSKCVFGMVVARIDFDRIEFE